MRNATLLTGLAAFAWSATATAQPATDIAEITAIEAAWAEALRKGDTPALERLLAPEFKLMRAEPGPVIFTPRAEWLANYQRFIFHRYDVRTVDVVVAGDTAVATVEGGWKVGMQGRDGTREENFILSDTFVRRGGRWQVLYRHSTPLPIPPPPTGVLERGR